MTYRMHLQLSGDSDGGEAMESVMPPSRSAKVEVALTTGEDSNSLVVGVAEAQVLAGDEEQGDAGEEAAAHAGQGRATEGEEAMEGEDVHTVCSNKLNLCNPRHA